jgi:hypothetical protein
MRLVGSDPHDFRITGNSEVIPQRSDSICPISRVTGQWDLGSISSFRLGRLPGLGRQVPSCRQSGRYSGGLTSTISALHEPAEEPQRVPCLPRAVIALGRCILFCRRLHMEAAIFVAIFVAIFLPLILSGEQWRAAQDRARARRMAEHRMNARLLRLNI